jgi:rhomboid protease GluP
MQDAEPGVDPTEVFPVRYSRFGVAAGNPEFRGRGRLAVEGSGQRFVFSGKPRGLSFSMRGDELALRADQVRNVAVKGSRIEFTTTEGRAGARKVPFTFFCESPGAAARIAALLPGARDADFAERQAFEASLSGFGQGGPWSSVTHRVVAANVLVFVVMAIMGAGWLQAGDIMVYVRLGANNGAATTDGQWWRLLTSMFMHYGVAHLALNMWALVQVGHLVERMFGRRAFTLIYFGSGITGGLASVFWHGDKMWSAGASGAIFGVYGSLLGFMQRDERLLPKSVYKPLLKSTALFVAYNLVFGAIQAGIDNADHLGGLAGGTVLGWLMAVPADPELRARFAARRFRAGLIGAALMVAVGVAVAPRFDYRPMEEFAWQRIVSPLVAREPEIVKQENAEVNGYRSTGDPAKMSIWMTYAGIPFYDDWRKQILELPLEPGRATYRRREALARILQMKVDSFRHLLEAVNGPEPYPLRRFDDETNAITKAVNEFPAQ